MSSVILSFKAEAFSLKEVHLDLVSSLNDSLLNLSTLLLMVFSASEADGAIFELMNPKNFPIAFPILVVPL